MQNTDSDRLHGLRRWDEWLTARIKPWGIVRETGDDPETRDALWRIGFPDDTRARIRVADEAVRLGEEGFEELTLELEERDWMGLLKTVRPGGIRIHADGRLDEVGPEGVERQQGRGDR